MRRGEDIVFAGSGALALMGERTLAREFLETIPAEELPVRIYESTGRFIGLRKSGRQLAAQYRWALGLSLAKSVTGLRHIVVPGTYKDQEGETRYNATGSRTRPSSNNGPPIDALSGVLSRLSPIVVLPNLTSNELHAVFDRMTQRRPVGVNGSRYVKFLRGELAESGVEVDKRTLRRLMETLRLAGWSPKTGEPPSALRARLFALVIRRAEEARLNLGPEAYPLLRQWLKLGPM
jgi:hypothetical protein